MEQITHNDFRSGVYLHYKGNLYEATHLTHNASLDDRIEVHYVGLQLDGAGDGPRHCTREFEEFTNDFVHPDKSRCEDRSRSVDCSHDQPTAHRFLFLGTYYQSWMQNVDPWSPQLKE